MIGDVFHKEKSEDSLSDIENIYKLRRCPNCSNFVIWSPSPTR
ncbi:hypothetical protein ABI_16900 [Asticcacaulis biprosthecium C19]|uniref:Uncharacterized protein n=1 Tax=Asticcacaulis biprosthecium C19 TaxID=715226 RepID=F4QK72_9CAUL|nr:hypothetical protein ABI_16900 [Asticcacaulis biprosthecium C19]